MMIEKLVYIRRTREALDGPHRMILQYAHGAWLTANLPPELKPARDALCRGLGSVHCGIGMASEILAALGILMCCEDDR